VQNTLDDTEDQSAGRSNSTGAMSNFKKSGSLKLMEVTVVVEVLYSKMLRSYVIRRSKKSGSSTLDTIRNDPKQCELMKNRHRSNDGYSE
jgi:hypothetical protein